MANLAAETKDMGFQLEQVQGFTPTPMTVATVIYYSGYHPYTLKKAYVPKSKKEKDEQHRFFFWYKGESELDQKYAAESGKDRPYGTIVADRKQKDKKTCQEQEASSFKK